MPVQIKSKKRLKSFFISTEGKLLPLDLALRKILSLEVLANEELYLKFMDSGLYLQNEDDPKNS